MGATGLTSSIANEDLGGEILTGWANGSLYISNVTRGGFQDLGYDAVILPVPEPSQSALALLSALTFLKRRRAQ